uniref:SSD domain-containing protein n=1 Tax=Chenopodium quinoa TaxID=63459 RepID=A0A803N5E1_CHEQI
MNSVVQVLLPRVATSASEAKSSNTRFLLTSNDTNGVRHAPGICAMYDICGARSDGRVLNCPLNAPAVKPDGLLSSKIQSLCPTITGNVCCTEKQFDTLRSQVQQVNNSLTVDAIEFYVTDTFGEGLYNSCKDVKFGTMNTRAIEFVAGGAKDFKGWFAFVGRQVGPNVPGSPYAINFTSSVPESSGMSPMNVSTYACSDTLLGCSCGDCPSSPTCSNSAAPSISKSGTCSIKMGSVKANCSDIVVAVVFVVSLSVFLGWGFVHQKRKMSPVSRTKPLASATSSDGRQSTDQKDGDLPLPIVGSPMCERPLLWAWDIDDCSLIHMLQKALGDLACTLIIATIPDGGHGKAPSILTEDNIKLLFEIQKKVDGIQANFSGSVISLTDICYKPLGQDCATQSILQYFKMNADNFDSFGGVDHIQYCFEHYSTADNCRSAFKAPLDPSTALGGYSGNNYSEVSLGLSGVMLVMLSVLGSVGFFSAIGVKSTLIIMEVIPFLVLAVGVDNMCILVNTVKRQPQDLPLEGRISNALVEVGPSISLASLSEVLAFAVGTFIPMPAVRVFSMFAALAVLLDFLLQVTAFVALIVFDFKRTEKHRVDCFPCKKASSIEDSNNGISQRNPGLLARYMKDVHAPILSLWGVKILVVSVFVAMALSSIILTMKALQTLCTRIEPGLEQQIVLPRDSYLQVKSTYYRVSAELVIGSEKFNLVTLLQLGLEEQIKKSFGKCSKQAGSSSESRQTNQLCSISHCDANSLVNEITRLSLSPESSYIAKPAASWLDDFLVWMSPEAFGCCRKFVNGSYCPPDDQPPCCSSDQATCGVSELCKDCTTCFLHSDLDDDRPTTSQFQNKLPWFLKALPSASCAKGGHGAYTNSVDLQGYESGVIQASEFRTYHTPLNKQTDFVNALREAREFTSKISKSLKMEVFPYSVFYMFFEQYLDIWSTALVNLAIAIGAVFVVCLIITWSIWSSLIILLVITMIVVDLMGVMAILKIQLNAVSVVNLVMSVGIAVEFCVHITHAFMVSGGNRDQRMKEALGTMGASVFSGITLTKLVGVIVLAFARSQVFVVYYFQMYLALVILGFLHGLIFLPVLLSMFGPPSRLILENEDARPSTSSQF